MKSFSTLLAASLLMGSSAATQLRNKMKTTPVRGFAESEASIAGTQHNCQYAINRINNEASTNYTQIVQNGAVFTDANFPANSEMIRWNDYPGSDSLTQYATYCKFQRLTDKINSPVLFANISSAFDIDQGQESDCYWITATSDDANTGRIKEVFRTQNTNRAGI